MLVGLMTVGWRCPRVLVDQDLALVSTVLHLLIQKPSHPQKQILHEPETALPD